MLRGGAAAIVVATFVTAGAMGASVIRNRAGARPQQAAGPNPSIVSSETTTVAATDAGVLDSAKIPPAPQQTGASTAVPQTVAATVPPPVEPKVVRQQPVVTPVVPAGESDLAGGVTAMRGDTDVVVAFDTPMTRTRRPEKFEQFVRSTLPLVYGAPVRDALAKIPDGTIAGQGELLTELPKRGVSIPLDAEWTLRLYPETRQGQDGPLVIRYRVAVVPASE